MLKQISVLLFFSLLIQTLTALPPQKNLCQGLAIKAINDTIIGGTNKSPSLPFRLTSDKVDWADFIALGIKKVHEQYIEPRPRLVQVLTFETRNKNVESYTSLTGYHLTFDYYYGGTIYLDTVKPGPRDRSDLPKWGQPQRNDGRPFEKTDTLSWPPSFDLALAETMSRCAGFNSPYGEVTLLFEPFVSSEPIYSFGPALKPPRWFVKIVDGEVMGW